MRVAIDYTTAIAQGAGIGRYVRCLVEALIALDSSSQYELLACGRSAQELPFPSRPNVEVRHIFLPDRHWFRWQLPFYSRYFSGPVDIYHGPNFALPSLKKTLRKIVTIHDLAYLEYPQYVPPATRSYLNAVVPAAIAEADVVVAVSHSVARALNQYYRVPREKIAVIPNGVGTRFRHVTDPIPLEETRRKFGLHAPFVLSVGTLEPRKNHLGLIKAFTQVREQRADVVLALAGDEGWLYEETRQIVTKLKLEGRVRFLGRVSEDELVALYNMAEIFAFPSFYEGFGIPPLEAMACGAPVITSNMSSLPEVVGDAALMLDPYDIDAIAASISHLLEDRELRESLRQKGYERARSYSWHNAASKMLSVYRRLYNGETVFGDEVELS